MLLALCIFSLILLFNKEGSRSLGKRFGIPRLLRLLKIENAVKKTYQAMHLYAQHREKVFQAFLISLVAHFATFIAVFLLSKSLNATIPITKIFLVMPIITVICMLPVTMNGLGLREWAFVLFYRSDIGNAAALSLSLLFLSMFLIISVFGGIAYLLRR